MYNFTYIETEKVEKRENKEKKTMRKKRGEGKKKKASPLNKLQHLRKRKQNKRCPVLQSEVCCEWMHESVAWK